MSAITTLLASRSDTAPKFADTSANGLEIGGCAAARRVGAHRELAEAAPRRGCGGGEETRRRGEGARGGGPRARGVLAPQAAQQPVELTGGRRRAGGLSQSLSQAHRRGAQRRRAERERRGQAERGGRGLRHE